MQEAAKAENYECEISAYSAAEAVEKHLMLTLFCLDRKSVFPKAKLLRSCRVFRSMLLICVCTAAWTVKAHWLLQKIDEGLRLIWKV